MYSTARSVAGIRVLAGQEQQIDVAERRQHAAAVAAGRGHAQSFRRLETRFVQHVLEQSSDHAVDQRSQQARRLQSGELFLLERLPHIGLNSGQMAPERRDRRVAGNG